jgi:hypothetical protein
MLKQPLLALMLLVMPPLAIPGQQEFAYQASLGEVDQPLQRVTLPLEVILALTRSDLGDIAVFNADGKQLVHAILRAPVSSRELSQTLPFHEFSRYRHERSKTVTTREQKQQAGSLSEVETTQSLPLQSLHRDYLVEIGDEGHAPAYKRIELQWTHEPAGQILELRVEIGNELDAMHVLRPRKSLTNLESTPESTPKSTNPGWRSIADIPPGYRYLRLTPLNNITRFELHQVVGQYLETGAAPVLSHRLATQRIDDGDKTVYRIDFPSQVPAESLRVVPATSNRVIKGHVYASWGDSETLSLIRRNFRQHNLDSDDIRPSEPIRLPRKRYRRLAVSSETDLPDAPSIELIYPQYELLFLGDGNAPYTLAWGNYQSTGSASDLAAILRDSLEQAQLDAGLASLGTIEESGGAARLAAQPAMPWKKWLLWTLLIIAVIVTVRMALRLYREMNPRQSSQAR